VYSSIPLLLIYILVYYFAEAVSEQISSTVKLVAVQSSATEKVESDVEAETLRLPEPVCSSSDGGIGPGTFQIKSVTVDAGALESVNISLVAM
jgi:hypothetical protein